MDFPEINFDYSSPEQCQDLLASVPLTNLDHARDSLVRLIRGMLATPPAPLAHLELLEQSRGPIAFVAGEIAKRYSFQPLPPGRQENDLLQQVVSLWQAMARSYSDVASRGSAEPEVQSRLALICQRCIHYSGRAILEHFRARREIPPGLWIDLHGYYATAEEWQIANVRVVEPQNESHPTESCQDAYAALLLIDLANPYGRSPREFVWAVRWAHLFAQHTRIVRPTGDPAESKSYGLDLMLDHGLRPLPMLEAGPTLHRFDGAELAPLLQQIILKLREGVAPSELRLGNDVAMPQGARLLLTLYRPWCHMAPSRRFQRREGAGEAELTFGFEPIHYYVSGDEFVQPEPARIYSRAEVDSFITFGPRVEGGEKLQLRAAQIGYVIERWRVANESVGGFRLRREGEGQRIENSQLLGIRPPDGDNTLLAQVSWTMFESTGALLIGLALLPGTPNAIAARQTGINVANPGAYHRAFMLPGVPALKEPNSLVLPRGWFQQDRIVEVYTDHCIRVKLTGLLQQGVDFDRAGYTLI